jgi:hypothetical protein
MTDSTRLIFEAGKTPPRHSPPVPTFALIACGSVAKKRRRRIREACLTPRRAKIAVA